ncbi:histidine phosphatase family protein [Longimicrobium terrae]|uniref:Broad specificity phosphatase PhoE n=1 Tax=Longimicrobium terrae TaxID=1639882 RepID=A0A841H5L9_9BACT|nr:histidine phosphatase family protein [Longimicrobium terrae]MBB4639015.1 broad specificity phosphatase PhoE [Longimicrobium terrae]MBB6073254.1 broad specificity phosphatase PhoE [Longimicrobium terrae]NNC32295.1 histidine phosphatase family protein [Longimicrobium terrae]
MERRWPDVLWIVRHGQSAGNVASDAAHLAGLSEIAIAERDVDVPLSALGEQQASALGRWFAAMPEHERPTVVLASPYLRARRTAELIREAGGFSADLGIDADERLREKEFGILDRLTRGGVAERFPEQAEFRRLLGKFYHRPPGGESWCDVILRLRSALDTLSLHQREERVLIVCHQVVVLCMRYLLECMTEAEILGIDAAQEVANCSVTSYEFNPRLGPKGKMELTRFNFVAPLEVAGAPVTTRPDEAVAAR